MEDEANRNLYLAIEVYELKVRLQEQFYEFGQVPLSDATKMPLDLFFDMIEADFQYRNDTRAARVQTIAGREEITLFDDSRKKAAVSAVDAVLLLNKLKNESKIMTFSGAYVQNKISKLHRYLKTCHKKYQDEYANLTKLINSHQENDVLATKIGSGYFAFKCVRDPILNEYKFVYMLGALEKSKLDVAEENREEVPRVIINEESNVLYGRLYVAAEDLDELLQRALDLKQAMAESDRASEKARERDYKRHRREFRSLLSDFAAIFQFQNKDGAGDESQSPSKRSIVSIQIPGNTNGSAPGLRRRNTGAWNNQGFGSAADEATSEDHAAQTLGKFAIFVPKLTMPTVDVLIKLFGPRGLKEQQNNYLAIFRYLHSCRYQ